MASCTESVGLAATAFVIVTNAAAALDVSTRAAVLSPVVSVTVAAIAGTSSLILLAVLTSAALVITVQVPVAVAIGCIGNVVTVRAVRIRGVWTAER
jgi:hypothetical protein